MIIFVPIFLLREHQLTQIRALRSTREKYKEYVVLLIEEQRSSNQTQSILILILTALEVWVSTIDPLFLLSFAVEPYSMNSCGIQLGSSSQNERGD